MKLQLDSPPPMVIYLHATCMKLDLIVAWMLYSYIISELDTCIICSKFVHASF